MTVTNAETKTETMPKKKDLKRTKRTLAFCYVQFFIYLFISLAISQLGDLGPFFIFIVEHWDRLFAKVVLSFQMRQITDNGLVS